MLLKIKEDNMRNGKKTPTWGVLVVGIMFLAFSLIMLLVDIVYAFVDPRIKAQYEGRKGKK